MWLPREAGRGVRQFPEPSSQALSARTAGPSKGLSASGCGRYDQIGLGRRKAVHVGLRVDFQEILTAPFTSELRRPPLNKAKRARARARAAVKAQGIGRSAS
jgi:hypothetical protein